MVYVFNSGCCDSLIKISLAHRESKEFWVEVKLIIIPSILLVSLELASGSEQNSELINKSLQYFVISCLNQIEMKQPTNSEELSIPQINQISSVLV